MEHTAALRAVSRFRTLAATTEGRVAVWIHSPTAGTPCTASEPCHWLQQTVLPWQTLPGHCRVFCELPAVALLWQDSLSFCWEGEGEGEGGREGGREGGGCVYDRGSGATRNEIGSFCHVSTRRHAHSMQPDRMEDTPARSKPAVDKCLKALLCNKCMRARALHKLVITV